MRKMFFAAIGALLVAGFASAQQPVPVAQPAAPTAAAPTVIRSNAGCTNCGSSSSFKHKFFMATGGNCKYGSGCQNGCGSLKSNLAFTFGSCKNFFDPCGPTCHLGGGHGRSGCSSCNSGGGLFGRDRCPTLPLNQPYGTAWGCPRQYDSYANH